MKVVVIHPDLQELGGGEKVFSQVIEALLDKKHDITVVGKIPNSEEYQNIETQNIVQISCAPYTQKKSCLNKLQVYKRLFERELYRIKFRGKIGSVDLEILTQDPMLMLGVGKKTVAYVYYPEYVDSSSKPRFRKLWKVYYFPISTRINQLVKKIDLLLCCSEYTKKAILKHWGREAQVIYPPVEVEKFNPAPKENFVVSVGRFIPAKNYDVIVEVARRMPQLKFIVIGRKPRHEFGRRYYEKIDKLRPANLTLLIDLSSAETISILNKARIYLHAMIGEHFGISIVEAMAAGCIPIVHNSGGPKESIGNFGYTYKTITECVGCINKALDSKIPPSKIAENTARFSSEKFRKNLISVLEKKGFLK